MFACTQTQTFHFESRKIITSMAEGEVSFCGRLFKRFVCRWIGVSVCVCAMNICFCFCACRCKRVVKSDQFESGWSIIKASGKTPWVHYQFPSHVASFVARLFALNRFFHIFSVFFAFIWIICKWAFELLHSMQLRKKESDKKAREKKRNEANKN